MTYETFIFEVENAYGKYPKESTLKTYIMRYLRADINESSLAQLFAYVLYSHPKKYGPPDISAIERAIDRARDQGKWGIRLFINPLKERTKSEKIHIEALTDAERAEGERILKAAGGLKGLFAGLKKADSPMGQWERKNENN